jgi:hypothetical protein
VTRAREAAQAREAAVLASIEEGEYVPSISQSSTAAPSSCTVTPHVTPQGPALQLPTVTPPTTTSPLQPTPGSVPPAVPLSVPLGRHGGTTHLVPHTQAEASGLLGVPLGGLRATPGASLRGTQGIGTSGGLGGSHLASSFADRPSGVASGHISKAPPGLNLPRSTGFSSEPFGMLRSRHSTSSSRAF